MEELTGNIHTDRLLYAYLGIRLANYLFFLVLNSFQTFLEGKELLKNENKMTTRFFIFGSIALFCALRVISTSLNLKHPDQYIIKTLPFLFFTLATTAVFLTWVFILHFWLLIMYSFFVSDEVRFNRLKPINYTTTAFATALIVYQITISTLGMIYDIKFGQAVGFMILLLIYSMMVVIFGSILLHSLKIHKKNSPFEHYNEMIYKTKILLGTVITVFVLVVVEEIIYQFAFPVSLSNNVQSNFIIMLIDTSQMIVVMYVLANGKIKNYILFKKVKTTSYTSGEKSSSEIESGHKFNKKSQPSFDNTNKSFENQSIDMDCITSSNNALDIIISTSQPDNQIMHDSTQHLNKIDNKEE